MRRILTQWAITGVLLLGAPLTAAAAPVQKADGSAAWLLVAFAIIAIVLAVQVVRQLLAKLRLKPTSREAVVESRW